MPKSAKNWYVKREHLLNTPRRTYVVGTEHTDLSPYVKIRSLTGHGAAYQHHSPLHLTSKLMQMIESLNSLTNIPFQSEGVG